MQVSGSKPPSHIQLEMCMYVLSVAKYHHVRQKIFIIMYNFISSCMGSVTIYLVLYVYIHVYTGKSTRTDRGVCG